LLKLILIYILWEEPDVNNGTEE